MKHSSSHVVSCSVYIVNCRTSICTWWEPSVHVLNDKLQLWEWQTVCACSMLMIKDLKPHCYIWSRHHSSSHTAKMNNELSNTILRKCHAPHSHTGFQYVVVQFWGPAIKGQVPVLSIHCGTQYCRTCIDKMERYLRVKRKDHPSKRRTSPSLFIVLSKHLSELRTIPKELGPFHLSLQCAIQIWWP